VPSHFNWTLNTAASAILEVKTDNKVLILCEVWGSESSFAEDSFLLACGTVIIKSVDSSISEVHIPLISLGYFSPEDEGTTVLCNNGNYSANDTATRAWKLEFFELFLYLSIIPK
jgi:hypothetical protein